MSARTEGRRVSHKPMKLYISVADGVDPLNGKDETMVDVTVFDDMKLATIHQTVTKVLQLKDEDKYTYSLENSKQPLDFERTIGQLGMSSGDKVVLESGRRKRRTASQNGSYESYCVPAVASVDN
jgi:hypothetical protein